MLLLRREVTLAAKLNRPLMEAYRHFNTIYFLVTGSPGTGLGDSAKGEFPSCNWLTVIVAGDIPGGGILRTLARATSRTLIASCVSLPEIGTFVNRSIASGRI